MDIMCKHLQLYIFTCNTIKKLSFKYKGSLSNGSQPLLFQCLPAVDPCRVESGLIIFRISLGIFLEEAISQLHHRIHVFTALADNSWLRLLLRYEHFCTISDPQLWQKSCQINGRQDWDMATCLCDMLISMGDSYRPPKLSFGSRYKIFSFIKLILKKNFKKPSLRSIDIYILKWFLGFFFFFSYL